MLRQCCCGVGWGVAACVVGMLLAFLLGCCWKALGMLLGWLLRCGGGVVGLVVGVVVGRLLGCCLRFAVVL